MENYIFPECGNIMDRKYSKKDDCLHLKCDCSDIEYTEDEFEECRDCGDYFHLNMVEYDEDNDEFFCSECE